MNYFSHAFRFLDRPYFLAGTALPDWLSVADRQSRLRSKSVAPFADGSGTPLAELAAGVLQHLHDDQWFHNTPAFHEVTGALSRLFREALAEEDVSHRAPFLGHIVTELLLDDVLIAAQPERLDRYYATLALVDAELVQSSVNQLAKRPAARLAQFIPLFRQERFLADYSQPQRLLVRLNQVLRRVTLQPLPFEIVSVLVQARRLVSERADDLLADLGSVPSFSPEAHAL